MDPGDPIYRAMIAAARAPAGRVGELEGGALSGSPSAGQSGSSGLFGQQAAKRNKSALMAAFGAEAEEEQKPRALRMLNYSAEELAAAQASARNCSSASPLILAL